MCVLQVDIGVQLMGFYGLSGDVTVSTVDRSPDSGTSGQVDPFL